MKLVQVLILVFVLVLVTHGQNGPNIVTTDLDNFWLAYDKIVVETDPAKQLAILNAEFVEKATPGQRDMFRARRYTPAEYIDSINKRRSYWDSVRPNTLKAKDVAKEIGVGIEQLRFLYPDLKPANIYFTVGVFRSGGTTMGNNVLIGSEIAFADEKSMANIGLTNVHEYVHTQQKSTDLDDLLSQSVMEGVAELVSVKAMQTPSVAPAVSFGPQNEPRIKTVFASQMFNPYFGFWLYSDAKNEFNTRDLGYYVGYAIAELYYEKAKDKKLAIKEMIELDYTNAKAVAEYVDRSDYFTKSVERLRKAYEDGRPRVETVGEFRNGQKNVSPAVNRLTLRFSREMNKQYRNFEFGPLGEGSSLRIKSVVGFSEDGRTLTLEIEPLQPNRRYQIQIGSGFRDAAGIALRPYLIDISTAQK